LLDDAPATLAAMKKIWVFAVLSVIVLGGCKRAIDKEHMDAAAAWSKKVCACKEADDPQPCSKKVLKDEPNEGAAGSESTNQVFTPESLEDFRKVIAIGLKCGEEIRKGK